MPGAFIEGIELIRQPAESNSNSFPIRLRRNGRERPVIFRAGDFSKAGEQTVVLFGLFAASGVLTFPGFNEGVGIIPAKAEWQKEVVGRTHS